MSKEKIPVNRKLVGILALVCLGSAAILFLGFRDEESWQLWQAAFTRVGIVMSAFWLALPSKHREAAWTNLSPTTLIGLFATIVAAGRFPKVVIPIAIVVAIIGLLLRPRSKDRPGSRVN